MEGKNETSKGGSKGKRRQEKTTEGKFLFFFRGVEASERGGDQIEITVASLFCSRVCMTIFFGGLSPSVLVRAVTWSEYGGQFTRVYST